jgi:iron complex transport system substrate-binding protein
VLLNADADFYFAGWNYGFKVGGDVTPASLAKFGIKSYELNESFIDIMARNKISLDDLYHDLRNLGKIFGVPDRAEILIAGYRAELEEAQASSPTKQQPTRVFVYDSG